MKWCWHTWTSSTKRNGLAENFVLTKQIACPKNVVIVKVLKAQCILSKVYRNFTNLSFLKTETRTMRPFLASYNYWTFKPLSFDNGNSTRVSLSVRHVYNAPPICATPTFTTSCDACLLNPHKPFSLSQFHIYSTPPIITGCQVSYLFCCLTDSATSVNVGWQWPVVIPFNLYCFHVALHLLS